MLTNTEVTTEILQTKPQIITKTPHHLCLGKIIPNTNKNNFPQNKTSFLICLSLDSTTEYMENNKELWDLLTVTFPNNKHFYTHNSDKIDKKIITETYYSLLRTFQEFLQEKGKEIDGVYENLYVIVIFNKATEIMNVLLTAG